MGYGICLECKAHLVPIIVSKIHSSGFKPVFFQLPQQYQALKRQQIQILQRRGGKQVVLCLSMPFHSFCSHFFPESPSSSSTYCFSNYISIHLKWWKNCLNPGSKPWTKTKPYFPLTLIHRYLISQHLPLYFNVTFQWPFGKNSVFMYKLMYVYLVNICIMTLTILKHYSSLYTYMLLTVLVLNLKWQSQNTLK